MDIKPSSKCTTSAAVAKNRQKTSYLQTSIAIRKKLEEIKNESRMPFAINNNLSLFRYRV